MITSRIFSLFAGKKSPHFDYDPARGKFRFWLARITSYTIKNHIRKISHRAQLQKFIDIPDKIDPEVKEIAEKEWKVFISKMAWSNIKGDLSENSLVSFQKMADGQKPEAIARELGIEVNSVYVYKKRVEKKFYQEINRLKVELD